jgi:hypothetical protein
MQELKRTWRQKAWSHRGAFLTVPMRIQSKLEAIDSCIQIETNILIPQSWMRMRKEALATKHIRVQNVVTFRKNGYIMFFLCSWSFRTGWHIVYPLVDCNNNSCPPLVAKS